MSGINTSELMYPTHAMYEDEMSGNRVNLAGNGLYLAGNGPFNIGNSKIRAIKKHAPKVANKLFNTSVALAGIFGNESTQRRAQNAQLARSVIEGASHCVPAQGLRHKMGYLKYFNIKRNMNFRTEI